MVYNACLTYISWKSWAGYLSLSWGTVGCLRGELFLPSTVYFLALLWPPPLHNFGLVAWGKRRRVSVRQSHSQDARLKTGSKTHRNLEGQTLRYLFAPSPIAVFIFRDGPLPDMIAKILMRLWTSLSLPELGRNQPNWNRNQQSQAR